MGLIFWKITNFLDSILLFMKKILKSTLVILILLSFAVMILTITGSKSFTTKTQKKYMATASAINYYSVLTDEEAYYYSDMFGAAYNGKVFVKKNPCSWLGKVQHGFNSETAVDALYMLESDFPLVSCYIGHKAQSPVSVISFLDKYYICASKERFFDVSMYDAVEQKACQIAEEAWNSSDGDLWTYVDNVYSILSTTITYAEESSSNHSNDIYGALIENSSACLGMSCAFKYILDKHNVPCFIATGIGADGIGHAWVTIKLNDSWYCGDITSGYKIYSTYNTLSGYVHLISQDKYLENITMDESGYRIENSL